MERKEVTDSLSTILKKVFKDDSILIKDDLNANDVDNWDSLSHMMLITEIETVFSIRFKLKDLNRMRNIGDMTDVIISKL